MLLCSYRSCVERAVERVLDRQQSYTARALSTEQCSTYCVEMSAELIRSRTRRDCLVLEGYMYVQNVVKDERIYWECVEKRQYRCLGRAVSMDTRTYCSRRHTHPADKDKVQLRKVEELCSSQALSTERAAEAIVSEVVLDMDAGQNPYLNNISLLRLVRRARRRERKHKTNQAAPPSSTVSTAISAASQVKRLPTVDVVDEDKMSCEVHGAQDTAGPSSTSPDPLQLCGEQALLSNHVIYLDSGLTLSLGCPQRNERWLLFTSSKCVRLLAWHEWALDVDTNAVPDCFAFGCLLTVLIRVQDQHVACAWVLLSSLSTPLLSAALQAVLSLNPNHAPSLISVDYHIDLVSAVQQALPTTRLCASFEHLRRAVLRGVRSQDVLMPELKQLLALAFIPPHLILSAFEQVDGMLCNEAQVHTALHYFEDTFIGRPRLGGGRKAALFPVPLWNCHRLIVTSQCWPMQIWPERTWNKTRCAVCRLSLSEVQNQLEQESRQAATLFESLLTTPSPLRTANCTINSLLHNTPHTDITSLITQLSLLIS